MRGLSPSLRILQRAFWKQGQNRAKSALAKVNNRDKHADVRIRSCKSVKHGGMKTQEAPGTGKQCDASPTGPQECDAGLLGGCAVQEAHRSS